ncbi:hypothetical protein D9M71_744850 [compost metagenome]
MASPTSANSAEPPSASALKRVSMLLKMAPSTPALRSWAFMPLTAWSMFRPMLAMPAPTAARATGQPAQDMAPKSRVNVLR